MLNFKEPVRISNFSLTEEKDATAMEVGRSAGAKTWVAFCQIDIFHLRRRELIPARKIKKQNSVFASLVFHFLRSPLVQIEVLWGLTIVGRNAYKMAAIHVRVYFYFCTPPKKVISFVLQ